MANHLGNVLVTISDKKIPVTSNGSTVDYYTADVVTANDYYPFGMGMPGRKYNAGSSYRYGFNGKENDNDVKGEGNQQDYGMRIYDPRLGRFLSVDPLTMNYPWNSTYAFAEDDVIRNIDLDGGEIKRSNLATVSNKTVLTVASAQKILKEHQTYSFTLNKKDVKQLEKKLTFEEEVSEHRKMGEGMAWFQAVATGGKVGHDQNPILSVSSTQNSAQATIKQNKDGSNYLETTEITRVIEVDVQGGFSTTALNGIKVTTTTTVTTQQLKDEGENYSIPIAGEGFSTTTNTVTKNLTLSDDYTVNYLSLPAKLRTAVDDAHETNRAISGEALKGISNNFKKGEENASEGKNIQGKGKYYTMPAKPPSGNF